MPNKLKKIFVFRLGPIGDIVNAIPLIKYLKNINKQVEIIYICEPLYFPIVSRIVEIDKIYICEIAKDLESVESIKNMAETLINLYGASEESEFIALHLLKPLKKLAEIIGVKKFYEYRNRNFLFSNLNLWKRFLLTYNKQIDFDSLPEQQFLPLFEVKNIQIIKEKLKQNKINLEKNLIALIPGVGANLPHKAWPISHFVKLIQLIQQNLLNTEICLVGGIREKQLFEQIFQELKCQKISLNNVYDLNGQFELNELVDFLSLCEFCIGPDSGAVHIAAGMNIKTICLFGPTSPIKHKPIQANIIKASCSVFCKLSKKCVFPPDKSCMHKVMPEEVLSKIIELRL